MEKSSGRIITPTVMGDHRLYWIDREIRQHWSIEKN